jgi:hypothetical protein
MSILCLPKELIIEISRFIDINYIVGEDDYEDHESHEWYTYEGRYYPLWCLYATSKHFSWLNTLEYVCIEDSEFKADIVCRNINGQIKGMQYGGLQCIGGYYGSEELTDEYNYSYWLTDTHYFYRISGKIYYRDDCMRPYKKRCENHCLTCQQLDVIQEQIFKHDDYVTQIIKNPKLRIENSVFVRQPKNSIYFKFDHSHLIEYVN